MYRLALLSVGIAATTMLTQGCSERKTTSEETKQAGHAEPDNGASAEDPWKLAEEIMNAECECKGDAACKSKVEEQYGADKMTLLARTLTATPEGFKRLEKMMETRSDCLEQATAELKEDSKVSRTELRLAKLAFEAYPQWALATEGSCPKDLAEFDEFTEADDRLDAWGHPLHIVCGETAPEGVVFGLSSGGPDGVVGTDDDLHSWE